MTSVCPTVGALVPHALVAETRSVLVPGPTVPDNDRWVVGKAATNEPVTERTKLVGAGPLAAGSQTTVITLPTRDARKFAGASGAPEQVPGKVTLTGFEGPLLPAALVARNLSV
jgi:hypothetical protein